MPNNRDRDPGDAVPPGVAAKYPPPLTERDREVRRKLEHLGEQFPDPGRPAGTEHPEGGSRTE